MSILQQTIALDVPPAPLGGLARIGEAMRRHRRAILALQWLVVAVYAVLLIVPAFMPLPPESAHLYDNLRLFAQFAFWGIWWPFAMLSMMLVGRLWCGVLCPEGALTEFASRHGLGRSIPRWMRWSGWPFVAFVCTTVYGQLVSVYEYPQAALLVLGGSTLAALAVGFVYGRGKRVWCRHLCPANGVFGLLAKLAPLHFAADERAWREHAGRRARVDCAPLVDLRHLKSASPCHACGRCSGHRDAIYLRARKPGSEILESPRASTPEALLLVFGILGIATAAFQWSISPWFVSIKMAAAQWLVDRNAFTLLQDNAPWWLLTHYPAAHDVFTWLDGLCILGYILGGGLALGTGIWAGLRLAARLARDPELSWQRLALALLPLAGVGIFLGLSMLTLADLKAERVPLEWVPWVRALLLAAGASASAWLGWMLLRPRASLRRLAALAPYSACIALLGQVWYVALFRW
ncbi:MAG: 4Fe-4S binding protein [Betaproteobacteria bacterium]|nr:4Fe-4S binding protein [Betaproteobacteria bacterium]